MSPFLLIPFARVQTAAGGNVMEVNAPLFSRKPRWIPLLSIYVPTISPLLLMSRPSVKPAAPGTSIVVNVGPLARLFAVIPSARVSTNKQTNHRRHIFPPSRQPMGQNHRVASHRAQGVRRKPWAL